MTAGAPRSSELLVHDISEQPVTLDSVLTGPAAAAVAQARESLGAYRQVRFVGIGSSRHVAGYAATCTDLLAAVPSSVMDAPGAGVALPRLGPGQLVVVVSQSGATPALLAVAAEAHARGATVWALTNGPGSALERAADLVIPAGAGPESVVPATKSVTAMMLLARAISAPVEPGAVQELVRAVAALVADEDNRIATLTAHHRVPDAVVVGGFAGQWVADEVAIKLAEITAHLAVSESLVDYLHGPSAVPAPALAFLHPADPNAAAVTSRPAVVTVGPSQDYALPLDSCGDVSLDAIAQVVAGQCLALGWARAADIDPDDPRGLQKVTLTR